MGLKNFFGLERRRNSRHEIAIDVEFQVWDESALKPLTRKCSGGLTNISLEGACLQTNHILIAGHHLMIHNDVEGKTPLILEVPFPASEDASPRKLKAQVIWYKKVGEENRFQFDVGLKFIGLSEDDQKNLECLLQASRP
jgi:c-di-GMP-binding flagellar brake protein YcgR